MGGEIWPVVKTTLKVTRIESTEGIMGDAKDQWAEKIWYCNELGALWRKDDFP